jgi:F-type H+-transporting ATPase subunit epsilon
MANTLKLEIVTPDARVFSDQVEMVSIPGSEGEMAVYPRHVPLMSEIVSGQLVVRKDGKDILLAVGGGFVQVTADRVAILTDMAMRAENIDEAEAEAARQRAEARLAEKLDEEESVKVQAALAQSLAKIKVKHRLKQK